jgi:receptor expression-enhancing protein 5/6
MDHCNFLRFIFALKYVSLHPLFRRIPQHIQNSRVSFSLLRFCLLERFKELEEKTGHSKVYFFLGAVLLVSTFILGFGGLKLVTDLVGFLYPAYMSFKSMESSPKGVPDDATQWLTYWVIFSSLTVIEGLFTFIVNLIPFYYGIKMGLIIWLYHPKTTGAEVIYNQIVRPKILPHLEGGKKTE